MSDCILQKSGALSNSDDCTATKAQLLEGYIAITSDSDDEPITGSMHNYGSPTQTLNCNGIYNINAGYYSGGKVTVNSLASQTSGTATANYIYSGKTAWVNGAKITGGLAVSPVASFTATAYSTSQILCKWKNPSKGPYSGVAICAKTNGYPTNAWDGRVYTGVGSNTNLNSESTATIGNLSAGTVYYIRIWMYCTCSAGEIWSSSYLQATCSPTAHGRKAYTASGIFTVPSGVRSINIHCTGGGGKGGVSSSNMSSNGGGGGYTSYKNSIAVSPGQQIPITVGAGDPKEGVGSTTGGTSSAGTYVSAAGGNSNGNGGSGGGASVMKKTNSGQTVYRNGLAGGSDGNDGARYSAYSNDKAAGTGQHTTTKEFGSGTLYSGGGGSEATSKDTNQRQGGAGGAGGGGTGAGYGTQATSGSAGTGGGGGGGNRVGVIYPGAGGSGNVIITW